MSRTRNNSLALRPVDPPAPVLVESGAELEEGVYGMKKACLFLDRSEWQVRHLVETGRLEALQDGPGCRLYFRKAALKAYLDSLKPVHAE